MSLARRCVAPVFLCVLFATPSRAPAAAPAGPKIVFETPSGERQAGPLDPTDPFAQVLPSGRIVRPLGKSVVTGMGALGLVLSPDGRYAIVSNDDERGGATLSALDPLTSGGYSLAVVDTATLAVVDRYRPRGQTFFAGLLAVRDPLDPANTLVLASGGATRVVYALDLDPNGHLTPDAHPAFALPAGAIFPGTLVVAPDRGHAYVVDELGGNVATLDLRTRAVSGAPIPVGFFPSGAALSSRGLLVTNEGLAAYAALPVPAAAPAFVTPPEDLLRASSLSLVGLDALGVSDRLSAALPMDPRPDGVRTVGGAHPVAVAALRSKPYAFVALGNVDRIATVELGSVVPRVIGGTELRLFAGGPYGTQPTALALAEGQKRLYVALAGIDAVAVLDVSNPRLPHRLGLIPTGWYPTALALSADGKHLFVANAKGFGQDPNLHGGGVTTRDSRGRVQSVDQDSSAVWSTLQRIDLSGLDLRKTTAAALSYLRAIKPLAPDPIVPPAFSGASSSVKHVVFILEESKTYDAMLGDLSDAAGNAYGPGDPSLVAFDREVTPNLHALAATFGLAGNLYADADDGQAGHQFASAGVATSFTERTLLQQHGRAPLDRNQDPEDYPRAGYIFNALARAGMSYRDYGDLIRLSGYDDGASALLRGGERYLGEADGPGVPTKGFGGTYALDVPAPAALADRIDPNYPGYNPHIRDVRRAREFQRDFDAFEKAGRMPDFTYIWLPSDRAVRDPSLPPPAEQVADGDRALGAIVEYLTHLPEWSSTAIFITPAGADSSRDHVHEHRTYAIVVSPFAKRHYLGMRHLSTVSILKTEEELLGLPPLALGDTLTTDMSDFFTPAADLTPYVRRDAPLQNP
jgi:DNA-binding beta-propeller fold protein YncE